MNIYQKRIIAWVPVLLWMVVIFMFSSQNGNSSGHLSGVIVDYIAETLASVNIPVTDVSFLSYIVRKLAHMFIYFVLALLTTSALYVSSTNLTKLSIFFYTIALCFLYAASDEFHQSFSPGRAMALKDVFIDTSGALIGATLYHLVRYCVLHKKRRKT